MFTHQLEYRNILYLITVEVKQARTTENRRKCLKNTRKWRVYLITLVTAEKNNKKNAKLMKCRVRKKEEEEEEGLAPLYKVV